MGVSLSYELVGPLSAGTSDALMRDVDTEADAWEWWCEPILLWRDGDGVMGDTTLFNHVGDPDDEDFMAMRDVLHIVRTLTKWSKEHDIAWELMLAGEEVGRIEDGRWNQELVEFIDEVTEDWPESEAERSEKAEKILASVGRR